MDGSEALAEAYRMALKLTGDRAEHKRILDDINRSIRLLEEVRTEAAFLAGFTGEPEHLGGPDGFR